MTMFVTAQKLDVQGWVLGVIGALISGGAGAVSSGFATIVVDPDHFNIGNGGTHHLLEVMGITFLISGIVSMAKFLQIHPVPTPVVVNQAAGSGDVNIKVEAPKDAAK